MRDRAGRYLAALLSTALFVATARAADPSLRCESSKLKLAGDYGRCRLRAESKAVSNGLTLDVAACEERLLDKWSRADAQAGPGVCPSENDQADIQNFIDACSQSLADALGGGSLPLDVLTCNSALNTCTEDLTTCTADLAACQGNSCGDGTVNAVGEQCDGSDLDGSSCVSLGHDGGSLSCTGACRFDASGCTKCPDGALEFENGCWFLGAAGQSCDGVCASVGLVYDTATDTIAGSTGIANTCYNLLASLGATAGPTQSSACGGEYGCFANVSIFPARVHCSSPPTTSSAANTDAARACACQ